MNILFVDDNIDACDAFVDLFLDMEVHIQVAHTGEEALEACERDKYDWVFMDLKMPGMGGSEAAKIIKQRCPDIRIIICTGNTDSTEIQKLADLGITEVIFKPYDPRRILKMLEG